MAKGFKHGSGSLPLNFKVVGNPQPTNPKENTIWVNTDAKITGYYFAPEQPENMAEGEVWCYTGKDSSSKFNALKKNGLFVYPQYAKQYVNGALVDVTAMIYQGSSWVDLTPEFVIFESGKGALVTLNKYKETYATITVGTETIDIGYTDTQSNYVTSLRTAEVIDMAKYSKLSMEFTATKRINSNFDSFGVTSTAFTKADPTTLIWIAKKDITASNERQTITVDLSSVNENLYVALQFAGAMSITRIWLE